MNIGWEGILYFWISIFKILFIPMLLIPLFLVPSFYLIKRKEIVKRARLLSLATLFSYVFIIIASIISVYTPVNTMYRYVVLWLFELAGCFFIILVLFRRQLASKPTANLFSNRNVAIGMLLFFVVLVSLSFASRYISYGASFDIDGNIIIVEIDKITSDIEKITSILKQNVRKDSIVLVKINSPGGTISAARNLSNYLFALENRTCCYIDGDCFKVAVFIALSCDEIVMNKNSKLGNLTLNVQDIPADVAVKVVNSMKKTAFTYSKDKYNPSVILAMFGEKTDDLASIDSTLIAVSKEEPAVLSPEQAERLHISQKTVDGISEVLTFLKKE